MNYADVGKGIEVLRQRTIAAANETFVGKPLVLEHVDPRFNSDAPEILRVRVGTCDRVGFTDDGWAFSEGPWDESVSAEDRQRYAALNPSCGYRVLATGRGGRWNNIPYERELTRIEFHHLALCKQRSRYEESEFRLNAVTNPQGEITMFKFLRKFIPAGAPAGTVPVTEEVEIPSDTVIKIGTREVRLNDVIAAEEKANTEAGKPPVADDGKSAGERAAEAAAAGRLNAAKDDTLVIVAGKQITVRQLRENAEARENATRAATEKSAAEARENVARGTEDFRKLANAAAAAPKEEYPQTAGTLEEGMKRGKY